MFITVLVLLGLCLGSFINALVWRIHKQSTTKKKTGKYSISKGRSMCVHCGHELRASDLVPVLSWLLLWGKCRYCSKSISWQYPAVELVTALAFVISYIFWPAPFNSVEYAIFGLWLACLVGLIALVVYDIRWMLLPNRIVVPLYFLGFAIVCLRVVQNPESLTVYQNLTAVLVGGGLFYLLFQISRGKWIGGGDVKLGFLLGALVGRPDLAFLMLFLASVLGCIYIFPQMLAKKLTKKSRVPFGPFLILATFIVVLFGNEMIIWYFDQVLLGI